MEVRGLVVGACGVVSLDLGSCIQTRLREETRLKLNSTAHIGSWSPRDLCIGT
jgi:hypothetical protein